MSVFNRTRETLLADRIQVADTPTARLIGLLGKRSLPKGRGLWIIPSQGVHTFGMTYAIDVVFLDKLLRVVGLREAVAPYRITRLNFKAESVLELPAHTISKSRTQVGDELVISEDRSLFNPAET